MAIIRNAANQLSRGRSGQSTYYVSNGRQIMRPALNNSNYGESARRSAAQQIRRVKWANLVNLYKVSAGWMPKAFESKKKGQTDYNKFMQVNVNAQNIALTRDEALNGAIVVSPVQITQGSLTSINLSQVGAAYVTNLALGSSFVITGATTVAEFTAALVANTPFVQAGMQLSFVQYFQNVDANNVPHATCSFFEVTLDAASTDLLSDYLPEDALNVVGGFLATASDIDLGGFAYILSQKTQTGLKVSSQSLVVNNATLIAKYTGAAQVNKAIDSYGLDTEVILNPESVAGASSVVVPQYISAITLGGIALVNGQYISQYPETTAPEIVVTMANRIKSSAVTIIVADSAGNTATAENPVISGKSVTGSVNIRGLQSPYVSVRVIGEEDEYSWTFPSSPAPAVLVPLTIYSNKSDWGDYTARPRILINNVAAEIDETDATRFKWTAQVGQNQQTTIQADPNDAQHQFLGWSDNNNSNPRTLVVTESMELGVNFLDLGRI